MNTVIWKTEIKDLEKLCLTFKGKLPALEKELEPLMNSNDPVVVMVYSRRILEVIITKLCETELNRPRKTEPLKGILDKLNNELKVPSHIITSMHSLNSLSAYGAHPKDFEVEQVKPVINNLSTIIKWYLNYQDIQVNGKLGLKNLQSESKNSESQFIHSSQVNQSIAVLPFTDMSPERNQEFLGDGLAEGLLTILSQLSGLKVTGRTSSFSFKNKEVDLKTIGEALHVDNILEGSIQKAGNRVRITAQLINAADGYHIWSERYDREMEDIFALQDDICSKISEHLKVTLLDGHKTILKKRPTKNPEAYELFLKGDFYNKKYTREGFEKAIEYFEKAIELDPEYADAWWYLGFMHFELHAWLSLKHESIEKVIYCAKKAMTVDETCADAHFLLALVHFNWDFDWDKVEQGIELGNKYLQTQFPLTFLPLEAWYKAMVLSDFDFANKRMQLGVEHDPLNIYYKFHLAQLYFYGARDYKKTISILNNLIDLGLPPNTAWHTICLAYLFDKQYELAEEFARKDYNTSEGKGHGAVNLIVCLAIIGKKEEAEQIYQIAKSFPASIFQNLFHARSNAYLGDIDMAFDYLDKGIQNKDYWLFTLKCSPEWDLLRSDSRFNNALERMKFPK